MSAIATMLADKSLIVQLHEERLSDGSKVYNLSFGDMSVACLDEYRAVRAFNEIATTLRNCCVESITTL